MKRGRRSKRNEVYENILSVLGESNTPLNISSISDKIYKKTEKNLSWNTVQKYMNELVKLEKVRAINLPHSKIEGKTGLTVYILKK